MIEFNGEIDFQQGEEEQSEQERLKLLEARDRAWRDREILLGKEAQGRLGGMEELIGEEKYKEEYLEGVGE